MQNEILRKICLKFNKREISTENVVKEGSDTSRTLGP